MIYNDNNKPDDNNYDNNLNLKSNQEIHLVNRKEPNINNIIINNEYKKSKDIDNNNDNMDEDDNEEISNKQSFSNSIKAFDSLKNYRKLDTQSNSKNNIRIINKNGHDINYCTDDSCNNKIFNSSREKKIIHSSKSDNSIRNNIDEDNDDNDDTDDNKDSDYNENDNESEKSSNISEDLKVERVKVTPRNEVNNNGDNEPFNELFINKNYILKKFDKMMVYNRK